MSEAARRITGRVAASCGACGTSPGRGGATETAVVEELAGARPPALAETDAARCEQRCSDSRMTTIESATVAAKPSRSPRLRLKRPPAMA